MDVNEYREKLNAEALRTRLFNLALARYTDRGRVRDEDEAVNGGDFLEDADLHLARFSPWEVG